MSKNNSPSSHDPIWKTIWTQISHAINHAINHHKKLIAAILFAASSIPYIGEKMWIGSFGNGDTHERVQERNPRLNHSFSLSELSREALIREWIMTTMYEYSNTLDMIPMTEWRMSKVATIAPYLRDMSRRVPQTWSVLLRTPDMKTMQDIKNSVSMIREENPAALIAMDFEGGYIYAPQVSESDIEKYWFPKDILSIGREEKQKTGNPKLIQFPSAEFIGMKYRNLKDENKRREFLTMMESYGEAIARLFSHYGVSMILWPSLDITNATIGTKNETSPLAKNDRAFSHVSSEVSALGNAFIAGTMKVKYFIAVPKHFIWVGLTIADTDKARSVDTDIKEWVITPFRDYLNLHEIKNMTPDQASALVTSLQSWGQEYMRLIVPFDRSLQDIDREIVNNKTKIQIQEVKNQETEKMKVKKSQSKKTKSPHPNIYAIGLLEKENAHLEHKKNEITQSKSIAIQRINEKVQFLSSRLQTHPGKPPVIMVGNNDNNFYETGIPGTLSKKTIDAVLTKLSTTNKKRLWWIWHSGIVMTDDLNTWAIRHYIGGSNDSFSATAAQAFWAWSHILLFGDSHIAKIVDWAKNIPTAQLIDGARRVLDMKTVLGMYTKTGDVYTLNPKQYAPTAMLVKEYAITSKRWDWKKDAYIREGWKIPEISPINGIKNALTNSILDTCRIDPRKIVHTLCSMHPRMYDTYRAPNEDSLKKQLIIVDKRAQMLYAYDLDTRVFIQSKPIAIGKGTPLLDAYHDKRVAWDKKTPVGYYMLVQKKDPQRIRETIEPELYDEYGGDDGGMLVLAWSWQPQIAIHGTKKETVWKVSSGCVRMDNTSIKSMMDSVPLGSMVVITN
jgi:lipoprotein-anchoring transpeptidase ErfK/SrfK/beta-glucosidase-like glycosyl hydrolase